MFEKVNLNDFWSEEEWAKPYLLEPFSDETLREIEEELGYKLPESYVSLLRQHNGGCPKRSCVKGTYFVVEEIFGLDRETVRRNVDWTEEWGYPDIGLPVCSEPSGHAAYFLDYRDCGADGEPKVVEIEQESDYCITVVADTFEEFIGKLVYEEDNDSEEQILENIRRQNDPYRDVELLPLDDAMRKTRRRAIWGEYSWGLVLGWGALLLAGVIVLLAFSPSGAFLQGLSRLLLALLVSHGAVTLLICLDCLLKSRKPGRYYADRVSKTWDENDKSYFSLETSRKEKYLNPMHFKSGDAVYVFVFEKGDEVVSLAGRDEKRFSGE